MNSSIIRYILGNVMRMEACFLLLPCIVSLVYGEGVGLYYLGTAIVCLVFGVVMAWKKPKNYVLYSNIFELDSYEPCWVYAFLDKRRDTKLHGRYV